MGNKLENILEWNEIYGVPLFRYRKLIEIINKKLIAARPIKIRSAMPDYKAEPPVQAQDSPLTPELVIAISTVPRCVGGPLSVNGRAKTGVVDYLSATLDKLNELIRPEHNIGVLIMNHDTPGNHSVFENNKIKYTSNLIFEFVDNPRTDKNCSASVPREKLSVMKRAERKLTCDVVTLLKTVRSNKYVMVMEDDFQACSNLLTGIADVIKQASKYRPDWLCIRVSYGMNGLIIPVEDTPSLVEVLIRGASRKPCDILVGEWLDASLPRTMSTYKWNLLAHSGQQSTLPRPDRPPFPGCGDMLNRAVPQREKFDNMRCGHNVVSPCEPVRQGRSNTRQEDGP